MVETLTDSVDEGAKPRLTYSVDEAANLLGISRNSAFAAAKRGELPSVMVGHRRLVPVKALERFLADLEGGSAKASETEATRTAQSMRHLNGPPRYRPR